MFSFPPCAYFVILFKLSLFALVRVLPFNGLGQLGPRQTSMDFWDFKIISLNCNVGVDAMGKTEKVVTMWSPSGHSVRGKAI